MVFVNHADQICVHHQQLSPEQQTQANDVITHRTTSAPQGDQLIANMKMSNKNIPAHDITNYTNNNNSMYANNSTKFDCSIISNFATHVRQFTRPTSLLHVPPSKSVCVGVHLNSIYPYTPFRCTQLISHRRCDCHRTVRTNIPASACCFLCLCSCLFSYR